MVKNFECLCYIGKIRWIVKNNDIGVIKHMDKGYGETWNGFIGPEDFDAQFRFAVVSKNKTNI